MLIIPTEKSFDWQHAPVVLFFIVLLNVLVFYIYQSGDEDRYLQAMDSYAQLEAFEQEWPLLQDFLADQGSEADDELLLDLEDYYADEDYDTVVYLLLSRQDFYQHLIDHQYEFFEADFLSSWSRPRARIDRQFQSQSYLAFGLHADNPTAITVLSSQFLHGDTMHLLGNMFFLVICGFAVEAAIGHWLFLLFYLLAGIAGGLAYAGFAGEDGNVAVGASGAISGVMAMYLAIFRLKKIEFFYWFFVFVGYFRAPALLILPFYVGKEVVDFYTNTDSNVAFMDHAGGFVAGALLVLAAYYLKPNSINRDYVDLDQHNDPQQQALAQVYRRIERYQFSAAYQSLQQLIGNYGSSFELELMRYQLLKIDAGDDYRACAVALLTRADLDSVELEQLQAIWRQCAPQCIADDSWLSDRQRLTLAMQFAEQRFLATAEQMFKELRQCAPNEPLLGALARKLSFVHGKLKNSVERKAYEKLADELLQGGEVVS